jgi:hypothetical protein
MKCRMRPSSLWSGHALKDHVFESAGNVSLRILELHVHEREALKRGRPNRVKDDCIPSVAQS